MTVVLDRDDMRRTLVRIAHEIVEKNPDGRVALVGIHRRGAVLARRLQTLTSELLEPAVPLKCTHRSQCPLSCPRSAKPWAEKAPNATISVKAAINATRRIRRRRLLKGGELPVKGRISVACERPAGNSRANNG